MRYSLMRAPGSIVDSRMAACRCLGEEPRPCSAASALAGLRRWRSSRRQSPLQGSRRERRVPETLPPSSAHTRFRLRAAALTVRLPTSVEPVNAILFKVGVLGERRASGFAAAHEDEDVDEAVWSIRFRDELAKAESHRSLFGEASPTMKWNWISGCFYVSWRPSGSRPSDWRDAWRREDSQPRRLIGGHFVA
jgi:hypothetical protein